MPIAELFLFFYSDEFLITDRWPSAGSSSLVHAFNKPCMHTLAIQFSILFRPAKILELYVRSVYLADFPSSLRVGSSRRFCHYNAHSEITARREVGGMACTDQRLCCVFSQQLVLAPAPHETIPRLRLLTWQ